MNKSENQSGEEFDALVAKYFAEHPVRESEDACADQDQASDEISSWFAVNCFGNQEIRAAEALDQAGITVFFPMFTRWEFRRRQKARFRVARPLIPGYLFVLIRERDHGRVLDSDCVRGFLTCLDAAGEPAPLPIPPRIMLELQSNERAGLFDETRSAPKKYEPAKGDRAKVISGAWAGFFARVIATPKGQRTHLMIEGSKERGVTLPTAHLQLVARAVLQA